MIKIPLHQPDFPQDHSRIREKISHYLSLYGIETSQEVAVENGRADIVANQSGRTVVVEVKIDYWGDHEKRAKIQLQEYATEFSNPFLVAIRLTADGVSLECYEVMTQCCN